MRVVADAAPMSLDVLVYEGTVDAPGTQRGGARETIVSGYQYLRVEFAAPVMLTPGDTYFLELRAPAQLSVTWHGMPPAEDTYAAGASSHPDVVSDFAFRTFAQPQIEGSVTPLPSGTATRTPTRTATISPSPTIAAPTATPAPAPAPAPTSTARRTN